MAPIIPSKKRKAVTRDIPEAEDAVSDNSSDVWALNGDFSDSQDESAEEGNGSGMDGDDGSEDGGVESKQGQEEVEEDELNSDEIPSEGDDDTNSLVKRRGSAVAANGKVPNGDGTPMLEGDDWQAPDISIVSLSK